MEIVSSPGRHPAAEADIRPGTAAPLLKDLDD
jgi:hypothetical protein